MVGLPGRNRDFHFTITRGNIVTGASSRANICPWASNDKEFPLQDENAVVVARGQRDSGPGDPGVDAMAPSRPDAYRSTQAGGTLAFGGQWTDFRGEKSMRSRATGTLSMLAPSILGGLLFLSAACASPDPDPATDAAPGPVSDWNTRDTTEVAAFLEAYLAAIDARDADFLGRAYVEDGRFVWIEDGEVRYRSAGEILESLDAFPAGAAIRTELSELVVVPLGEIGAHAWATFRTTVGTGPGSFSFGGAISFVLEREEGSWKLAGGHTSSPAPVGR